MYLQTGLILDRSLRTISIRIGFTIPMAIPWIPSIMSLIVECKARSKLDQNFYFKLNSLVDMFGVGAHKVLLTTANTEDNDDNRMQRERGNMMGITTISEIEEIQDIAETLMALLQ